MPELFGYLEESARRDTDLSWSWEDNGAPIPIVGFKKIDKFLGELPATDREKQKLLQVSGWYRSGTRRMCNGADETERLPWVAAPKIAEKHHIPQQEGVYKLLYANATGGSRSGQSLRPPSIFVSPSSGPSQIHEGDRFLIVDDTIHTGGTLRDVVRHINNRGGRVVGIISTEKDHSTRPLRNADSDFCVENIAAISRSLDDPDAALEAWKSLGSAQREAAITQAKSNANRFLSRLGLTFDQLTNMELFHLMESLRKNAGQSSLEEFWREQTEVQSPALPIDRSRVERPEELAITLGTEYAQETWRQRASTRSSRQLS